MLNVTMDNARAIWSYRCLGFRESLLATPIFTEKWEKKR
jgi:hypothetical protein